MNMKKTPSIMRFSISRYLLSMILTVATVCGVLQGADELVITLTAADDARVKAIIEMDKPALDKVFSEDLNYSHSTGAVDDKTGYVNLVASGRTQYLVYDYIDRKFSFPAPDIALMQGKVHIKSKTGESFNNAVLSYLAVWRKEGDTWRFLAWQSCVTPDPVPAATDA